MSQATTSSNVRCKWIFIRFKQSSVILRHCIFIPKQTMCCMMKTVAWLMKIAAALGTSARHHKSCCNVYADVHISDYKILEMWQEFPDGIMINLMYLIEIYLRQGSRHAAGGSDTEFWFGTKISPGSTACPKKRSVRYPANRVYFTAVMQMILKFRKLYCRINPGYTTQRYRKCDCASLVLKRMLIILKLKQRREIG